MSQQWEICFKDRVSLAGGTFILEKENKKNIINLLLDIESKDFKEIQTYASKINIFNILKLARNEIRHSNMLAWLFDPNETHGVGSTFTRYFMGAVIKENRTILEKDNIDFGKLLIESLDDLIVYREKFNIDILLVSNSTNQLICIENKVDTGEHDAQLNKYETILANNEFKDFQKIFLYLTPQEEDISGYSEWIKVSYALVVNSLNEVINNFELRPEAKLLIENYKDILRRNIMNDSTEIEKLCQDIYKKHKSALDLIFEYRPDSSSIIFDNVCELLQARQDIIFDKSICNKNYITFTTKELTSLVVPDSTKPNGYERYTLMYAISNTPQWYNGEILFTVTISPFGNEEVRNKLFAISRKYAKEFGVRNSTKVPQWGMLLKRILVNVKEINDQEDILEKLIKNLNRYISHDVKNFEKILQQEWNT